MYQECPFIGSLMFTLTTKLLPFIIIYSKPKICIIIYKYYGETIIMHISDIRNRLELDRVIKVQIGNYGSINYL